jgi:hypothetical protein
LPRLRGLNCQIGLLAADRKKTAIFRGVLGVLRSFARVCVPAAGQETKKAC